MKPQVTWILIADGGHARVLAHTGPGKPLEAVKGLNFSQDPLSGQELATGLQSGRAAGGAHGAGNGPELNPSDKTEAGFIKGVVERLVVEQRHGRFDRLVIAAPPQALGDIRMALTPQLKEVVMAELHKDLTNIPGDKLPSHFEDILAV